MKKYFAIFILMFMVRPAAAQEKAKIGTVDIQRVISESEPGKKARERFQAQVKKAEAEILKEKQEVERLRADFDKKGALLKEEDRRNLEKEILRRERGYQLIMRDSQEELRQREGELTAEIFKEIVKIVGEMGKNEKFTMILERSQIPYSDQSIDVTDKVIEIYNGRGPGKVTKSK